MARPLFLSSRADIIPIIDDGTLIKALGESLGKKKEFIHRDVDGAVLLSDLGTGPHKEL